MRLKTAHGTYVVALDDGNLLHLPELLDQDFDWVVDLWSLAVPIGGSVDAAIANGPLASATLVALSDGCVAFRRGGLYLCADLRFPELHFDRIGVGEWERFAIETADGAMLQLGRDGPTVQSPSLSRPVLIETAIGYQIMSQDATSVITVTCPEFSDYPISAYTMLDGSWIVDVDYGPDPNLPFLVYWFYPYNTNIHVWRLDQSGRRTFGYYLSEEEARSFLLDRRALGPPFIARLYMLSQQTGQCSTLHLLGSELCAAAEAGSTEALYAILQRPPAHSLATLRGLAARAFHVVCTANRARADKMDGHLKTFMIDALLSALKRLDPAIRGVTQKQLQIESDFREAFADPHRLPAVSCALPVTLHHHGAENLASILGGFATSQTLGIVLRPHQRTVEFHYIYSPTGIGMRMMGGVRYAYYVLSTYQADIWDQLAKLDGSCEAWTIRFEVGDLPTTSEPSVALQRQVGDKSFTLIPDLYYFDHEGFQRGWYAGDIPGWSDKTTQVLWRGSTTGAWDLTRETMWQAPRIRLCDLGRAIGPAVDFGITNVVQARSAADEEHVKTALKDGGLMRERLPQHIMGRSKFLVEIDGNANSWGFFAKLLMGCCILKVDSPFEQWFYDRLEPWVHYVPIVHDLSDLSDKVQWCLLNEDACREIAAEGRRLAEQLNFDSEMARAASAFVSLARPFCRDVFGIA